MKRTINTLVTIGLFATSALALAQSEYNPVPSGDVQYRQCLVRVNKLYDGGDARSPIEGQNKAQAYCTCLWNEMPEDFKGDISEFANSPAGQSLDRICVKYSNWD